MGKDYIVLQEESKDLMAYVRFLWAPCRRATLSAALAFSASTIAPAEAQELKKVRIGYPAFSLTFLTFFVAKDAGICGPNLRPGRWRDRLFDRHHGAAGCRRARIAIQRHHDHSRSAALLGICQPGDSQGGRPSRKNRSRGPPGNAPRYRRQRPHQKKRDESRESHVHPNR